MSFSIPLHNEHNDLAWQCCDRFGKIFTSHLFGSLCVVSADPEFNRFVLKNEMKLFVNGFPHAMAKVVGQYGISMAVGDVHRHMRSTILEFLSRERLRTIFLQDSHRLASQLMSSWKDGQVISAKTEATKVRVVGDSRY